MDQPRASLVGTWKSDPDDLSGNKEYGSVTLEFGAEGTLLYIIHGRGKDQVMRLTYTVDEEFIVTSQPSQPKIAKTRYEFTPDGKLLLAFDDQASRYIRAI